MGHLDLSCRQCGHQDFGVNSKKCVKCGSFETYVTSDEDYDEDEGGDEDWPDDDDVDLDDVEMESE